MVKTKTSGAQKKSSVKLIRHDPGKSLKDPEKVLETLLYCLVQNDMEAFQDVLIAHLRTVSKTKVAAETKLGRQTLYDLMDSSKSFNPTIRTLGPIFSSMTSGLSETRLEELAKVSRG